MFCPRRAVAPRGRCWPACRRPAWTPWRTERDTWPFSG